MYFILSVATLREAGNQLQAFALRKPEQQVHVLYRLSCGTLYEVIQCTHHNDTAGTLINDKIDVHVVAAFHPLGLGAAALIQHTDVEVDWVRFYQRKSLK